MNPFTYLWNRYKDSTFHQFHLELLRGWRLETGRNRWFDVGLFLLGIWIMYLDRSAVSVGYFILVLVVIGQGWIINCFTKDLRTAHSAFLRIMHILHDERVAARAAEGDGDEPPAST